MTRFWDGRTNGRSDCTPRPTFAFGDTGKNSKKIYDFTQQSVIFKIHKK